jgi:hypothetical protein
MLENQIKMIRLLGLAFIINLLQSCENRGRQLVIEKIAIEEQSCRDNCICLERVRIRYFFKSDFTLKEKLLSIDGFSKNKLIRYHYQKDNQGNNLYQYIYNDIDLSKSLSLNSVKKHYKELIYFNQLSLDNSKYVLQTNLLTKINFYLNGKLVNEDDIYKMNFPPLVPPPAPKSVLDKN